jgi:hypothetical protein
MTDTKLDREHCSKFASEWIAWASDPSKAMSPSNLCRDLRSECIRPVGAFFPSECLLRFERDPLRLRRHKEDLPTIRAASFGAGREAAHIDDTSSKWA